MRIVGLRLELGLISLLLLASGCHSDSVKGAVAQSACIATPGIESIYTADIVIFGDYHGTREPPQIVADAACVLLQQWNQQRVVIGLELPDSFNPAFEQIGKLASKEIEARIRENPFWDEFRDGRHSEAMLSLTLRLTSLVENSSNRVALVALERRNWDLEGAKLLVERLRAFDARNALVFVGNAHARKVAMPQQGGPPFAENVMNAGYHVMSLNIRPGGGETWFCSPECAKRPVRENSMGDAVKIVMEECRKAPCAYDGYYYVPQLSISRLVPNAKAAQ